MFPGGMNDIANETGCLYVVSTLAPYQSYTAKLLLPMFSGVLLLSCNIVTTVEEGTTTVSTVELSIVSSGRGKLELTGLR